jgi:N-acetylmuramoyl-L-alanine amidase
MSKRHIVRQGECLSVIATRYGFTDWKYLYNHPENRELRKKRPNPNILFPGDVIQIPEQRTKEEQTATGQLHRFVVKSLKKQLRIVFKTPKGEILDNEVYTIEFDSGRVKSGKTGGDGLLKEPVEPGESKATLEIDGHTIKLHLGHLNPTGDVVQDDLSGIQARLNNLGYTAGPNDGIYGRNTRSAIALLQADEDLKINGLPDEETLAKLEELHGC